jgi:antitoxin component YwqK of YwqJK toxin-antitoxin module
MLAAKGGNMKIIKTLFVHSLLLTSILVGFNVYAADQSICNPGGNVVLHDNGLLKSCQLKDDYDANNIRCKSGGSVSFYSNGKLESCILSADATIAESKCKADGLISFYIDGKLKSCVKQDS